MINEIFDIFNPLTKDLSETSDILTFVSSWLALVATLIIIRIAFVKRFEIKGLFFSIFEEISKIEWLSKHKTLKYSLLTVVAIILSSGLIFLMDKAFLFVRNLLIFPST